MGPSFKTILIKELLPWIRREYDEYMRGWKGREWTKLFVHLVTWALSAMSLLNKYLMDKIKFNLVIKKA